MKKNVKDRVLIVSHQLSRTGAPGAVYDLSQYLIEHNYTIDIISPQDGELRADFETLDVSVHIIPDLNDNVAFLDALKGKYAFIVVNTLACAPVVSFFSGSDEHVFWWIHENIILFEQIKEYLARLCLDNNITLLAAGRYVHNLIEQYMHRSSKILNICIPDSPPQPVIPHNAVRFIQVGLIDGMKGQEILLMAILKLPQAILQQCEFYFLGDWNKANEQIAGLIRRTAALYPCIHCLPAISRDELYSLYDEIDCIVVASKAESMSAVMIEGFMKEKICICTDSAGICAYMHDGTDGYIFPSGNAAKLAENIVKTVEQYNLPCMDNLRHSGRKIYEENFSPEVFKKNVDKIFMI